MIKFTQRGKITEANIQAECYSRLRNRGIKCYLDYYYEKCRFDMVVYIEGRLYSEIILIVEFKSKSLGHVMKETKQYLKYAKFGIPVVYCSHWDEIGYTIKTIKSAVELARKAQLQIRLDDGADGLSWHYNCKQRC